MNLNNIRLAHKLWGTVIAGLVLMLLAATFTQNRTSTAMENAMTEVDRLERSIALASQWHGLTEVVIERTLAAINVESPMAAKALSERTSANSATINQIQDQVRQRLVTPEEKEAFERIGKARTFALGLLKQVPEIKAAGDPATTFNFTQTQFLPAATTLLDTLKAFVKVQEAQRDAAVQAARDTRRNALIMGILITVAVLVGAIVMTTLLVRSIVQPLRSTVELAKAIGEGDLTRATLGVERQDEFGDLLRAFAQMTERLRMLVAEVRSGIDSVSTASSEIANGNHDLSSRTEQTASSLEQTAASMEQLTGTVTQSAETARQASSLASEAAQAATRGGEVVSQVIASMQNITDSSRRIADIIGVIDGIAFQTNILALNAAVEAARAGEQGRGFAVVAGEVRSLAQRSAEAAKEIKGLITHSVESVELGSRQVGEAGEAMHEIVNGVRHVSDLITEISAAASEQQQGIGQVNQAVSHLDQMTQQNAALVEESAAAASALQDQAHKLADVISVFNVGHMAARPRSAPSPSPAPKPRTAPVRPTPARAPAPTKAASAPRLGRQTAATTTAPAPRPAPRKLAAPAPATGAGGAEGDWESF